nr:MAG: hypothetical protein [Bacteriophage sp.]
MEPIVTINNYPIGWEWLDNVPLEDFNWLIEIFATMINNTDTYNRYNHNRYNTTTMKKKDPIYIPHQDTWTERFPNPGSNKNDYTLYPSDPQAQYNKLLRTQQKLRNKKK